MSIFSKSKVRSSIISWALFVVASWVGPVPVSAQSVGCVAPPDGLVSWWRAEGDGLDQAGLNNATLSGSVAFTSGEVGQAFSLNGTSDYLSIPANASLNVGAGAGFTFECWISPADLSRGQALAEWNNGAGGVGLHIWISVPGFGGGGSLFVNLVDTGGGDHILACSNVLTLNQFQHIALAYDKTSGVATFCLNGNPVASQPVGSFTPQTSYGLYLGTRPSGGAAGAFYAGLLDEATLYGRALANSEIASIFAAGAAGKCSGPAAPTIFAQPTSQAALQGDQVSLSVGASGSHPLSFQWQFGGDNITGANGSTLTIDNVQLAQAGNYNVVVSNPYGSIQSSQAVLTINPRPACVAVPGGAVSWWQGEGDTVDQIQGASGTLAGKATFGPGQVRQGFVFGGNGDAVLVGNPAYLQLQDLTIETWIKRASSTTVSYGSGGNGVIFGYGSGGYGLFLDPGGHLYFTAMGGAAVASANTITDTSFHHVAVTKSGVAVSFYVDGVGEAAPNFTSSFQFTSPAAIGARGDNLDNSFSGTIDELAIYSRALKDSEIQSIYHAGAGGKCQAAAAPTIITQPTGQTVIAGASVTFTVTASGARPISFQWRFNGSPLIGATSTTITLPGITIDRSGTYSVIVSNEFGAVTSADAVLVVNPPPPCVPLPAGLVSWWRGEGNLLDQIGGNSGNFGHNGGGFRAGEVGQALSFNGSSDFVYIPAAVSLDVGAGPGFTLEGWIQPGDVAAAHALVEWNNGAGAIGTHLWLSAGGAGSLFANLVDTTGAGHMFSSAPNLVSSGSFQHVALTYDKPSGTATLFLNGASVASQVLGGFSPQTSYGLYLGARVSGDGGNGYYSGLLDEITLYSRALTPAEIQGIFLAGLAGKCVSATPPFISVQPMGQTVTEGDSVTFSVGAGGAPPFTYQWTFGGANLAGATTSGLTLNNVQMGQAGAYAVTVQNNSGSVTSSNAMLVVNFPPTMVQVPDATLPGNGTGTVSVVIAANGNENALGFSLTFDPNLLSYVNATPGQGAANASLILNASESAMGVLGVIVVLPSDATFPPGTQELVKLTFSTAVATADVSTSLSFSDVPTMRQLADTHANALAATYATGAITIAAAMFEGDVSPRPNGDQTVTVTDLVLEGRYVARLDYPTNASEFQRADCAPRSTLGDGQITVTDWVQVGRYAAGLDPLTAAGGPTGSARRVPRRAETGPDLAKRHPFTRRQLQLADVIQDQGQSHTLALSLRAAGDENALAFSVAFDPVEFKYIGANLANSTATLIVNEAGAQAGRIGLALALPAGSRFPTGTNELVYLKFRGGPSISGNCLFVFGDQPVPRETADVEAAPLETEYLSVGITLPSSPALRIELAQHQISLGWPVAASGFRLQQADMDSRAALAWTDVQAVPLTMGDEYVVRLPVMNISRCYRLYKK